MITKITKPKFFYCPKTNTGRKVDCALGDTILYTDYPLTYPRSERALYSITISYLVKLQKLKLWRNDKAENIKILIDENQDVSDP